MEPSGLLFPKLVVLGATGGTGRQVVEQALKKGHSVTAVVRNAEKFDLKHANLEVCIGDVFEPDSLVPILEGKDAVLSCLGFRDGGFFRPTTLYSQSIKSITASMERSGLERIVCVTMVYTQKDPDSPCWFMDWLGRPLCRGFMNDLAEMEIFLTETKLCYTVVRPPCLKNDPPKGKYELVEGQSVPGGSGDVPRADLADFMLTSLQNQDWNRKGVAIDIKK